MEDLYKAFVEHTYPSVVSSDPQTFLLVTVDYFNLIRSQAFAIKGSGMIMMKIVVFFIEQHQTIIGPNPYLIIIFFYAGNMVIDDTFRIVRLIFKVSKLTSLISHQAQCVIGSCNPQPFLTVVKYIGYDIIGGALRITFLMHISEKLSGLRIEMVKPSSQRSDP